MSNYSDFLSNYNTILSKLHIVFNNNTEMSNQINELLSVSDQDKVKCGIKFNTIINKHTLKNDFKNKKVKIFSTKEKHLNDLSNSLFQTLSLKKIFNKRDDETKNILWSYVHLLYIHIEMNKNEPDLTYLNELAVSVKKQESLNTTTTHETKETQDKTNKDVSDVMIHDILSTFKSNMNGNDKIDPMTMISTMTKDITDKYGSDIKNGNINLQNMLNNMIKVLPELSDDMKKLDLDKFDLSSIQNMKGMENINIKDMLNQFNKGATNTPNNIIIDDDFSTDKIIVGEDKQAGLLDNIDIGDLLLKAGKGMKNDNPLTGIMKSFTQSNENGENGENPLAGLMSSLGQQGENGENPLGDILKSFSQPGENGENPLAGLMQSITQPNANGENPLGDIMKSMGQPNANGENPLAGLMQSMGQSNKNGENPLAGLMQSMGQSNHSQL
jgi:hypothetical protein